MTDASSDTSPTRSKTKTLLLGVAHVFALSGLALAQPLLDLLGKNAAFFVARGSRSIDIWILILVLLAIVPIVTLVVESIVIRFSERWYRYVQALVMGALAVLLFLQLFKRFIDMPLAIVTLAFVAGTAVGTSYLKLPTFRTFFTLLAPAPLVIVTLFLVSTPVSRLVVTQAVAVTPDVSGGLAVPVVVVVWDELNAATLMAPDGTIDAQMFPSFSALADDGTWYRRATGVSEATSLAVPAILDGTLPDADLLPIASDHPENLFTLLGNSHAVFAREPVTSMCPTDVCGDRSALKESLDLVTRMRSLIADIGTVYLHVLLPETWAADLLPPVDRSWGGFGEDAASAEGPQASPLDSGTSADAQSTSDEDVRHELLASDRLGSVTAFIESLVPTTRPPFVFLHASLPHAPYRYAGSGLQYRDGGALYGLDGGRWTDDEWVVTQAQQRLLMQTQLTDSLLGDVIEKLRELQIYDEALVVVTSDHGVGMLPGGLFRNTLADNYAENMSVPFIVKLPVSAEAPGEISDADVRTIDILPTVIDALAIDVDWAVSGLSLLEPLPERGPLQQVRSDGLIIEADPTTAEWGDALKIKAVRFAGDDGQFDVYSPGLSYPAGESVVDINVTSDVVGTVEILGLGNSGSIVPSGLSPTRIVGVASFNETGPDRELAVVVDGIVAAVGPILAPTEAGGRFSYFVPEELFAGSPGILSFYEVDRTQVEVRLNPLANAAVRKYSTRVDSSGQEFLELDGMDIPVGNHIGGGMDSITIDGDLWRTTGWAANLTTGTPASDIVIMLDGESVLASPPNTVRPKVGEVLGNPDLSSSGFAFALPLNQVESASSVRVFAVIGTEEATEMFVVGS